MVRVVVKTLAGEQVAAEEVPTAKLRSFLFEISTRPDLCAYIEGKPVPCHLIWQDVATAPVELATAPVPMTRELAPPVTTIQDVRTVSGALSAVIGDMTRSFQKVLESSTQALEQQLEMQLEMQRDMVDEAVRQRRLTAQCLGDIDLMHRAVKGAELNESLEARKARSGHGPTPQVVASAPEVGVVDILNGVRRVVGKKKE